MDNVVLSNLIVRGVPVLVAFKYNLVCLPHPIALFTVSSLTKKFMAFHIVLIDE